jgi:glucose/arabinose dehydrogenase
VAVLAVIAGVAGLTQSAGAAGPPLPVAANGNPVSVYAGGIAIPTQVAFKGKTAFIAGGAEGDTSGGLYYRLPGSPAVKRVPGTPKAAFGVVWHGHKLYVSVGKKIRVLSGWTGKRFKHARTLSAPRPAKKFNGFNGLGFGNGRLYAGITLNEKREHSRDSNRYSNSVVSLNPRTGKIKTVSKGLRQPWMMTFVKGIKSPFVTVLGQNEPADTQAPDLIVKAKQGANFGFPSCNWSNPAVCGKFDKPAMTFDRTASQPSPMGIAARGRSLYVALFNGRAPEGGEAAGPEVIRTNLNGSKIAQVMSGFVAPIVLCSYNAGYLYVGDLTGQVYRVRV